MADINFFVPVTGTAATASAFGLVFVGVDNANETKIEFFSTSNALLHSRLALAGGNQGLSFAGGWPIQASGLRIGTVMYR